MKEGNKLLRRGGANGEIKFNLGIWEGLAEELNF